MATYHTKFDVDFDERFDINLVKKVALSFVVSNLKAADEVWVVSKGAAQSLRDIGYTGEYQVMENGTVLPGEFHPRRNRTRFLWKSMVFPRKNWSLSMLAG